MKTTFKVFVILFFAVPATLILHEIASPPDHPWMGQSPIVEDGIPGKSTKPIHKTQEMIEAELGKPYVFGDGEFNSESL